MKRFIIAFLSLGLLTLACSDTSKVSQVELDPADIQLVNRLIPFDDCESVLAHIKEEASTRVGPYGLDNTGFPIWIGVQEGVLRSEVAVPEVAVMDSGPAVSMAFEESVAYDSDSGSSSSGSSGNVDFTGTNVQELGVDEPDIIKTDGERILVMNSGVLSHFAVNGGNGSLTSQVTIDGDFYGYELFIHNDKAFLFANGGGYSILPVNDAITEGETDRSGGFYQPQTRIIEIDLSDPFNLQIASEMTITGNYLSARLVGSTIRMAVNSAPNQLEWVYPSNPNSEERATRFNKELIQETTIEDWVPSFQLSTSDSTETGQLIPCDKLHKPNAFSGFDVLSVLSFNINSGLTSGDGVAVLASGRTVYSSLDRFFIATTKWVDADLSEDDFQTWTDSYTTDVHGFSISLDNPAEYVASGSVDGTLLNQFSMDEHDGYLRIVTTTGSPWSEQNRSESQLIVMEEQGNSLVQVGQVGGLGKGESLYSVRLLDDVGFAVTFRQIDPFYVIDLSDPVNPEVVGELKIPGFSTYLHPVDDNIILGVGQNADNQGRVLGLKVSSFDVSDPANPVETSTWVLENANSVAEYDHRAFQIRDRLAVVPVQNWSNSEQNGAVLLDVADDGELQETGFVSHEIGDNEKRTDCEVLDTGILIGTDLEFLAEEEWNADYGVHIQLCESSDIGGYGSDYCDVIPIERLDDYLGAIADDLIEIIGAAPTDRLEQCWPQDVRWDLQIQRSFFINDSLWTMSASRLQSNDVSDSNDSGQLPVISIIPIPN